MKNKKEEKYLTLYLDEYGDFATSKKNPDLNEYICGSGLRKFFNVSKDAKKIYLSVSETRKNGYLPIVYNGSLTLLEYPKFIGGATSLTKTMVRIFTETFGLTLPFTKCKTFYVACWEEV